LLCFPGDLIFGPFALTGTVSGTVLLSPGALSRETAPDGQKWFVPDFVSR
jgi:hypothetical protein